MTDGGRNETELERLDRNLNELLGELRVALPGVQVLFAFLLIVPFNSGFDNATGFEEKVYFVTLLLTAMASALLIAPSAYHRIQFRQDDKEHIVFVSNRFAVGGFAFLALAMSAALLLVSHYVFGDATAAVATVLSLAVLFGFWFAAPLRRRAKVARQR
jgi:hypothetical protein